MKARVLLLTAGVAAAVYGCGAKDNANPTGPASGPLPAFVSVSAASNYTCALAADSTTYCWGWNYSGSFGDGSQMDRTVPTRTVTSPKLTSLSAHLATCGLVVGGAAYCWGSNGFGALRRGDSVNPAAYRTTPAPVAGGLTFSQVVTKGSRACGIVVGGAARCWGYNEYGALGEGSTRNGSYVPTPVSGGLTFASLAAGYEHVCGLTTGGAAYCWGFPTAAGVPGVNSVTTPQAIQGGLTFTTLTAGDDFSCGLVAGGAAYCWGSGVDGRLGTGGTSSSVPTLVSGGLSFVSIVAGGGHACGIVGGGDAYCWGANYNGRIGDGTTTNRTAPSLVSGGLKFTQLSAASQTCGVTTDQKVYCWGENIYGQVGDGTTTDRFVPVSVKSP